jgi:hypothetical protein
MRCVRVDEDRHDIHVISRTVAAKSASRHAKDGQPRATSGGDRLGGLSRDRPTAASYGVWLPLGGADDGRGREQGMPADEVRRVSGAGR